MWLVIWSSLKGQWNFIEYYVNVILVQIQRVTKRFSLVLFSCVALSKMLEMLWEPPDIEGASDENVD